MSYLSTELQRINERMNQDTQERQDTHEHHDIDEKPLALAAELQEMFDSLRIFGVVHILVNGWLNLHLRLSGKQGALPARTSDTLLLLQPRGTILQNLPSDCSLDLALLVRRADPLKTLKELAVFSSS